jgi:hypothetical protein
MQKLTRELAGLGVVLALAVSAFTQGDGDAMVENPKYKFWAGFKPGASATYHEVTAYSTPDKEGLPDGKDEKTVTYKLQSVNKDRVVLQTTVVDQEFLGTIESAPTKATYPAKIKKAYVEAALEEFGAKKLEDETVKVGDQEIKCKVLIGSLKKNDTTLDYKLYYSDTVPGGIVKRQRVTKSGGQVVAETTVTLQSYSLTKSKGEEGRQDRDASRP